MKKNSIVLAFASPILGWGLSRIVVRVYKRNPRLFNYILEDILLPQLKNLLVDMAQHAIYRAIYGDAVRGPKGLVNYGLPNGVRYPYTSTNERQRMYGRY